MIPSNDLVQDPRPLITHIIFRLGVGGLENGLVNLINNLPEERYRHAIVCLTDHTEFRERIRRKDVPVVALHKREGQDLRVYPRMFGVLRGLRPDIVHSRNLAGLEHLAVAALGGVPFRIHGEHGRDFPELDGRNLRYNLLRRLMSPWVHRYIAVSNDLAHWLVGTVGVRARKVVRIYNGVDLNRFHPRTGPRRTLGFEGQTPSDALVVGTVGRLKAVKDQLTLVRAFITLVRADKELARLLRLVIVGDGPLRQESKDLLRSAQCMDLAWLPGERNDIPEIMQGLDLFVLPSLREGISNTVLEAMASGLPVVATRVGGNPELVEEGVTGMLVAPSDPIAMSNAIRSYSIERERLTRHGKAGRKRVEAQFSLRSMAQGYAAVYDELLGKNPRQPRP